MSDTPINGEGDLGCLSRFRLYSSGIRLYMSDSFNPLNPRNDLSCPNVVACINRQIGMSKSSTEVAELAIKELARLREVIKAQREQMERTEKVLADSALGVKQTLAWNKRLDELQAENKRLKEQLKEQLELRNFIDNAKSGEWDPPQTIGV